MNTIKATLFSSALMLGGCASGGLEYEPASYDGDSGYVESQISDNRYRVTFTGSSSASDDEVKDYALVRAAELTLLNDHDWFRVVSQDARVEKTERPTTMVTQQRVTTTDCGLLGCTTTTSPTYTGIGISTTRDRGKLVSSLEIVMGSGDAVDPTAVYNAKEIRGYLLQKHEG